MALYLIFLLLVADSGGKRLHFWHIYVDINIQVFLMSMPSDSADHCGIVGLALLIPLSTVVLTEAAVLLIALIRAVSIVIMLVRVCEVLVLVKCVMTLGLMTGRVLLRSALFSSVVGGRVLRILVRASPVLFVLAKTVICVILIFQWVI